MGERAEGIRRGRERLRGWGCRKEAGGHKGWGWGGMNGEKGVKGGLRTSEVTKEQRSLMA